MKSSVFSQAVLLVAGIAVLLIGALVKFDPGAVQVAASVPPPAATPLDSSEPKEDPPLPRNFPSALAQVVKLTRAGVGDDVILAYVEDPQRRYHPTADEIIYLHDAGVSEEVIAAVVCQKTPAPALATASPAVSNSVPASTSPPVISAPPHDDAAPEAPQVAVETPAPDRAQAIVPNRPAPLPHDALQKIAQNFMQELSPYGQWLETAEYGPVWEPTVEDSTPDWRPYVNDGQWEYTDAGWYWQSSYPWAWAAFHYGRWIDTQGGGWLWQPGTQWAPAWVTWRKTSTQFGWAPLPPGVSFNVELALLQDQHQSAANSYGLTPSSYTFVPSSAFLKRNLPSVAEPASNLSKLAAASVSADNLVQTNSHTQNLGLKLSEVSKAVQANVRKYVLRDASSPVAPIPGRELRGSGEGRGSRSDRGELAVYRPNFEAGDSPKPGK